MDIALEFFQQFNSFDLLLDGPDLKINEDLTSAIYISLFCDRRANANDVLPSGNDKRGWWGDSYTTISGDLTGSRLWLLQRSKQTTATLLAAQSYVNEALQWLMADGIASSITVATSWLATGIMGINITVNKATSSQQYSYVWNQNLTGM